jgi:hypothetical protein
MGQQTGDSTMNGHGNLENLDAFGNFERNIWGESTETNVLGQSPLDVWGHPAGIDQGNDVLGSIVGDGGVVDGLWDLFWTLVG